LALSSTGKQQITAQDGVVAITAVICNSSSNSSSWVELQAEAYRALAAVLCNTVSEATAQKAIKRYIKQQLKVLEASGSSKEQLEASSSSKEQLEAAAKGLRQLLREAVGDQLLLVRLAAAEAGAAEPLLSRLEFSYKGQLLLLQLIRL
jgi:hypothetical protein